MHRAASLLRSTANTLEARVDDRQPLALDEMLDLVRALRCIAQSLAPCGVEASATVVVFPGAVSERIYRGGL